MFKYKIYKKLHVFFLSTFNTSIIAIEFYYNYLVILNIYMKYPKKKNYSI